MNTRLRLSFLLVLAMAICNQSFAAPLTGTKTIPVDYVSLAAAIADLNAQGVGAGGVTINILPANDEVAPAGGYILGSATLNATTSAANPITITGNGNTITAPVGTGATDGIFFIQGTDYVTISGLTLQDTTTVSSSDVKRMEYGFAFVKLHSTAPFDGCQHNTIKNCNISLTNFNTTVNVGGIYMGNHIYGNATALVLTQASDANSSNTFTGDTIKNVRRCFAFNGYNDPDGTLYDQNNVIGGATAADGNAVQTFGYVPTPLSAITGQGVYLIYQNNAVVQNNDINNTGAGGVGNAGPTYGVYLGLTTNANVTIANNNIQLTQNTATSANFSGIYSLYSGSNASINVNNNMLQKFANVGLNAGNLYFIYQSGVIGNFTADNNKILNHLNYNKGSGNVYGIFHDRGGVSAGVDNVNITNNTMSDFTRTITSTGALPVYFYFFNISTNNVTGTQTISGNTTANISVATGTSTMAGITSSTQTTTGQKFKIFNNTISGLSNISGSVYGIRVMANDTSLIYSNTITQCTVAGSTGSVRGITAGYTGNSASVNYIYHNTINRLTSTATTSGGPTVVGMDIESGTNYIYNNFISDVIASGSTYFSPIVGIYAYGITSTFSEFGKNNFIYHNTINIGGAAGLTTGASGIVYSSADDNTIQNNILFINSTGATGSVAVIRRGDTSVGGAAPDASAFNANNNVYYAPVGANNYIYLEGFISATSGLIVGSLRNGFALSGLTANASKNIINDASFNTGCSLYKAFMLSPNRETKSFYEKNLSQIGSTDTYAPSGTSYAESNGVVLSAPADIANDYNSITRGSTPDIGALQFTGTAITGLPVIDITGYAPLTTYCINQPITITATITAPGGLNTTTGAPRLYYKKSSEANAFGTYPANNVASFNGWKYVTGTGTAPNFSFTIDYSKLTTGGAVPGDSITYFVIAQDNASTPNVTTNAASFAGGCTLPGVNLTPAVGGVQAFPVTDGYHILAVDPALAALATQNNFCVGSNPASATLSISPNPPGIINLQWQRDNGAGTWTDIPSATGYTYATGLLTGNENFRVQVRCPSNVTVGTSAPAAITIASSPVVTSATPNGRCGTGSVALKASGPVGNTMAWYDAATGGNYIDTGSNFTTPSITATTNFYVSSVIGIAGGHVGVPNRVTTTFSGTANTGVVFDAIIPFTLESVSVYPVRNGTAGAGNVVINLVNAGGTILQTKTITVTGAAAAASSIKTLVQLNWSIPVGTGYKLVMASIPTNSITLIRASGVVANPGFPFTQPGVMSITGGITGVTNNTDYNYFYDWVINSGCESARTQVVATVTPPTVLPAITGNTTICAASTSQLANTNTGGTWSSSNTNVATVSSTGLVTAVAQGTATITYTKVDVYCTNTVTTLVTVNPQPAITANTGTAPTCVASTATLANATPDGAWSTSNGSVVTVNASNGFVTAAGAGTANIIYTINDGTCTNTAITPVTVFAKPVMNAIGGTPPTCMGSSATLTNATNGGTWKSSNTNAATITSTGLVTAVGTGSASITYTVTDIHSCTDSITSSSFTVNPLPSVGPITGTLGLCMGAGNSTLSAAPASGIWISSDPSIATITSGGVVAPVNPGKSGISYTYTDISTGCTNIARDTVTVTAVPAQPTITGTTSPLCTGTTITLGSNTPGGTWTSSDPTTASIDPSTGIVSGLMIGSVTITYAANSGCATSNTALLTVKTKATVQAIAGTAPKCVGSTATLTNPTPGGAGVWSSSNTNVATVNSTSGAVTGFAAGTAKITYVFTATNGCIDSVNSGNFTINALPVVNAITGTPPTCVGSTATLANNTTGGTGVWSSSNAGVATVNSTSGLVTGAGPGNTTIIYTFTSTATGCSNTATSSSFPINALPTNSVITGAPAAWCIGNSASLADATTGGTWATSNPAVAIVSTSGVVNLLTTGSAIITYTTTGNGCSNIATTGSFTVNNKPAIPTIAGATSVCTGGTTTLTGTPNTGSWSSAAPANATVNSTGLVSGVLAGNPNIIYTVTANGCSSSAVNAMTVYATPAVPTVSGPTTVCTGGSTINLQGNPTGGTWSSNNTTAVPIDPASGLIAGQTTAGSAVITYLYILNGCSSSATYNVTANLKPALPIISGTAFMCEGGSVTLTSNPSTGGTWGTSNAGSATVSTNGVVTGVSAGSPNVTYGITTNGCTSTGSLLVTVNPKPAIPLITNGPIGGICQGDSVILGSNVAGGTWSSGTQANVTIDVNGIAKGKAVGSSIINYLVTNQFGCTNANNYTLVVNAHPTAPGAIQGLAPLCDNTTIQLSDITNNGVWASDAASIAAIDAMGVVSGVAAGTANITYTVTNTNNCTSAATVAVIVGAHPHATVSAGGVKTFCEGDSVVLTVTTTGNGLTYQWFDGLVINNATAVSYAALTSGNYQAIVTSNNCSDTSAADTVVVFLLPTPVITKTGYTLHTDPGYTSYQWFHDGTPYVAAASDSVETLQDGAWYVIVTDGNGCSKQSATETVTGRDTSTSVSKIANSNSEIRIYPNPATDVVKVAATMNVTITVCSIDGKELLRANNVKEINIGRLANAMYMIRIYNADGLLLKTEKLIKTGW